MEMTSGFRQTQEMQSQLGLLGVIETQHKLANLAEEVHLETAECGVLGLHVHREFLSKS